MSLRDMAKAAVASNAVEPAPYGYDRGKLVEREIAMLRDIARSLVPDVEAVPGSAGLKRRIQMRTKWSRRHPPYVATLFLRRHRFRSLVESSAIPAGDVSSCHIMVKPHEVREVREAIPFGIADGELART